MVHNYKRILEAKEAGYSDEDILGALVEKGGSMASRVGKAQEEGFEASDIVSALSRPPGKAKSIARAVGRGVLKGTADFAKLMPGPKGPIPIEQGEELLKETIGPTREEFTEKLIERGIPLAAMTVGPGGVAKGLGRAALAAGAGQIAEEVGVGPIGQTVAEIAALGIPSFTKRIQATRSQKELVNFLRKQGLSEAEIAPAIQGKLKEATLGKLAKGGRRASDRVKASREALGGVFDAIKENPKSGAIIKPEASRSLHKKLSKVFDSLPAADRRVINEDFIAFQHQPQTPENIMNFYQKINATVTPAKKLLVKMKQPLTEALKAGSPEIAKDFELINKGYSDLSRLSKQIQPWKLDPLINSTKLLRFVAGFKFPLLLKAEGARVAASQISTEFLTNPRFQNLGQQMIRALDANKFGIARKLFSKMEKEFPDFKEALSVDEEANGG